MDFPFGRTLWRFRGGLIQAPYGQPGEMVAEDWDKPTVLELAGAFIAQTSTSMMTTESREQALEAKSLFCEGALDVAKGDRIFDGSFSPALPEGATTIPPGTVATGYFYTIDGIPPAADTNPWTNWTPPREIPLTRYVG